MTEVSSLGGWGRWMIVSSLYTVFVKVNSRLTVMQIFCHWKLSSSRLQKHDWSLPARCVYLLHTHPAVSCPVSITRQVVWWPGRPRAETTRPVAVYLETHCNIGLKTACCHFVSDVEPWSNVVRSVVESSDRRNLFFCGFIVPKLYVPHQNSPTKGTVHPWDVVVPEMIAIARNCPVFQLYPYHIHPL